MDPIFEFLKLLLCCDVALSSPIGRRPPVADFKNNYADMADNDRRVSATAVAVSVCSSTR